MFCKYCGKELKGNNSVCPECGKDNKETKKVSPVMVILSVVCIVVLLALLGTMIYYGIYGTLKPRENDLYYKDNYTVSDKKLASKLDKVVATLGESKLTNAQLQVYYWMQIYNYGGYYNCDYDVPLNEQVMDKQTGMTYQQYFLDCALINWKQLQALTNMAEKDGYILEKEYQKILDELEENTLANAKDASYQTIEEFLQARFGKGITFAHYKEYFRVYYTGNLYFSHLLESQEVTNEEMKSFYEANKASLYTQWDVPVTEDMGKVVDVRHILITPVDEDKDKTISEAEWEACRVKAQGIYDEWLAGEANEDTFFDAAVEHSEDGNSYEGGLYESITKGIMVKEFEDWCMDESRQKGDHGMVKTQFGYHIMFFVGSEDGWVRHCTDGIMNDRADEFIDKLDSENIPEINFKAIVISDVDIQVGQ